MNIVHLDGLLSGLKHHPYRTCAGGMAVVIVSAILFALLVTPEPKISDTIVILKQVNLLTPRTDQQIGFELLIENDSQSDANVNAIEFDGRMSFEVSGVIAGLERAEYLVELDAAVGDQSFGAADINGERDNTVEEDRSMVAKGRLEYEIDTDRGERDWEYQIVLPVTAPIPAEDEVLVRLMFRQRLLTMTMHEGKEPLNYSQSGILEDTHRLALRFDGGQTRSLDIGNHILMFITNWSALQNPLPTD